MPGGTEDSEKPWAKPDRSSTFTGGGVIATGRFAEDRPGLAPRTLGGEREETERWTATQKTHPSCPFGSGETVGELAWRA
jgi:hypothetical protein